MNHLSPRLDLNIWEMDTGCYGKWDEKCTLEIRKSDMVICLLSENVSAHSVVYDEIREAKKLNEAGDLVFMPVVLTEYHNAGDLSDYTAIFAAGQAPEQYFDEIFGKVKNNIEDRLKKPLTSGTCMRVHSRDRHQHFWGRENDLEEIRDLFRDNNVVVLSGVGGIGKTELAKEFARRYRDEFADTYIFSYSMPPHTDSSDKTAAYDIKDLVCSLPFEKTPNTTDRDQIYRVNSDCLRNLDRKTLLIIDGCDISLDNMKGITEELSACHCRFMFTSRNDTKRIAFKEIKPMSEENILELFRGYYNSDEDYGDIAVPKTEISDSDILELAKVVDFHTLTVTLMAKLLRTLRKVGMEKLKNAFDVKARVYHERASRDATIYEHIANIFDLSELSEFKSHAMAILCRVCGQGIGFDALDGILGMDDEEENQLNELKIAGFVRLENGKYSLHAVISEVAFRKLPVVKAQEFRLMDWIAGVALDFDASASPEEKEQKLEYGTFYSERRADQADTMASQRSVDFIKSKLK